MKRHFQRCIENCRNDFAKIWYGSKLQELVKKHGTIGDEKVGTKVFANTIIGNRIKNPPAKGNSTQGPTEVGPNGSSEE